MVPLYDAVTDWEGVGLNVIVRIGSRVGETVGLTVGLMTENEWFGNMSVWVEIVDTGVPSAGAELTNRDRSARRSRATAIVKC